MRIRFYQVACGDAASITYLGNDGKTHHIFIDAGYERTYRERLAGEIKAIGGIGDKIDLWIISHIHDDHIGGVISYVKAMERGEVKDVVSRWWFNHPLKIVSDTPVEKPVRDISEAKSFAQGEKFTSYLTRTGHLPCPDVVQLSSSTNIAGLKIAVLSPTVKVLEQLREKYKSESILSLNYHDLTAISEPTAAAQNDYHKKVEHFDLNTFAEDASIENDSSIAILIEHNGKRTLWLADAWPSTIANALRNLGYSTEKPLKVDLVKVSHHGSRGNNSNEMYSMIRCNNYVFCASGDNKHQLPTKECMVRILKNEHRPNNGFYEFLFTHDNAALRSIFNADGDDIFRSLRFKMSFSASKWFDMDID